MIVLGRLAMVVLAAAGVAAAQNTARFEPLYRQALERRQAEFGAEDPRAARARIDLAMFLNEHDRPAEAEPLLRSAAAAMERLRQPQELSRVWAALAGARLAQGDGDEAEDLLRKAMDTAAGTARAEGV